MSERGVRETGPGPIDPELVVRNLMTFEQMLSQAMWSDKPNLNNPDVFHRLVTYIDLMTRLYELRVQWEAAAMDEVEMTPDQMKEVANELIRASESEAGQDTETA